MSSLDDILANTEDWDGFRDEAIANLPEHTRKFVDYTSWADEALKQERLKLSKAAIKQIFLELVGEDEKQQWQDDDSMCDRCEFTLIDDTKDCICVQRNKLRTELRKSIESL